MSCLQWLSVYLRHVTFNETIFPFHNIPSSSHSLSIITQPTISIMPFALQPIPPLILALSISFNVSSLNSPPSPSSIPIPDSLPFFAPTPVAQAIASLTHTNTHSMVTRGKSSIFKPKVLTISLSEDLEPSTITTTLSNPKWKQAMKEEFNALIKNNTWNLVSPPQIENLLVANGFFKLKEMLMVLWLATRQDLWPKVTINLLVLTSLRHLVLWLNQLPFVWFLLQLFYVGSQYDSWMLMLSLMES